MYSAHTAQEYDALKADPEIKFPEKHMLRHKRNQGQYQGCFSKTHWGGKRVLHHWDEFCDIAPKQAKLYSELPNHVRALLGIEARKHSNSKFKESDGSRKIPMPLLLAMENILMERIHLGEEVTYDFAAGLLVRLVSVWNEKLQELKADVVKDGHRILREHDKDIVGEPTEEQQLQMEQKGAMHMDSMLSGIRECHVSTQNTAVQILGCESWYCSIFCCAFGRLHVTLIL